ncbi:hypothetical protein TSACC_22898 [Terrimicrobium sacchariphilum]|uniref:PEP-CTERM protein-sorting domain-containing protein n=1 Tax=Terrimicrobium sacchariphilum TaxID=690879 RepID=A0A146GB68_TERSA|nr:hypothetical protein [Terrimicrobium sacchariphilum]GAT34473.1 hypothetical protein TSACC_22898 [Terrimicrobium sacchariphilum]
MIPSKSLPAKSLLRRPGLAFCLLLAMAGALSSASAQTLLSYWNFNNVSPAFSGSTIGSFKTTAAAYGEAYNQTANSVPGTLASNSANGTIFHGSSIYIDFTNYGTISGGLINGKQATTYTVQGSTSGPAGYGVFTDSTVNRASTDSTTGGSLLLLNSGGNAINKYITFSLSSAGYDSLSLSYSTRLTSGVVSSQAWTYSLDGTNYFALTTLNPAADSAFHTQSLNLSTLSGSALNNLSSFYLRMTYTTSNIQGSQSLDNIQLTGISSVPEANPTALAFCGLAVTAYYFRRRMRRF